MAIVLAGVVIGLATSDRVADGLNTEIAEHVAEIILAILLFVDATDVRGGLFGHEPRAALRILFVAPPLGIATALVLGLWLLPGSSWAVLLVIACIVVPIDFAPVSSILRDRRAPERCAFCSTSKPATTTASSRRCSSPPWCSPTRTPAPTRRCQPHRHIGQQGLQCRRHRRQ